MENKEFKTYLEVWRFLEEALSDNYNTFVELNEKATVLLSRFEELSKHYVNSNNEYVVLSTSKTLRRTNNE